MSRFTDARMANDMNRIQEQTLILAATLLSQFSQPAVAQMRTVVTPYGGTETYSALFGENFRAFSDRVLEQPTSRDDTIYSCDFVYGARTPKTCIRSLNIDEVGEPGDIRFRPMPGQYPNTPERLGRLANYPLVGQIGASGYTSAGRATAGYLCLFAAPGAADFARNSLGRRAPADEAICQVMLLYNGTLVVGEDTDPQQLPPCSLVVKGNLPSAPASSR